VPTIRPPSSGPPTVARAIKRAFPVRRISHRELDHESG
jgi:hypothetical protein